MMNMSNMLQSDIHQNKLYVIKSKITLIAHLLVIILLTYVYMYISGKWFTKHLDKSLNLDVLLIQLRPHISRKWYEFGEAVGINKEFLDKCRGYPTEDCIVEVLDHWLRKKKPTWKEVAEALSAIQLQDLSERIIDVYKTGKLLD